MRHSSESSLTQADRDAIDVIDTFLRTGGSVCVPAKRAALAGKIQYQVLPATGQLQRPVFMALRAFVRANGLEASSPDHRLACVLVDGTPDSTKDSQYGRAMAIQEEVQVAIARLNAYIFTGERWHRRSVRAALAAREHVGVHGGECRGADIIRFAMGPQYPTNHRRHVPARLIVPITNGWDVGWVRDHAMEDIAQTYRNITERNGEMLNAMMFYEDVDRT